MARTAADSSDEVRVRDHGPGVDPDFLDRAFDPFTQAHSALTQEHGGLRIGLFVTRQLIHAIGGRVELTRHARPGRS
jgi:signal transduction histidine kinase